MDWYIFNVTSILRQHNIIWIFLYMEREFEKSICVLKKNLSYWIYIDFNFLRFKVALYTKGSTISEPTSQYDDLNILWNCFYRSTFLYIIMAQWCRAWVLWTAHSEFKVTEISFWKSYIFTKKWFFICFLSYVT